MGNNCCVKDSTSAGETQVSYQPYEGSVVPVPKLNTNNQYENTPHVRPDDNTEAPVYKPTPIPEPEDVPPAPAPTEDLSQAATNDFEKVEGVWYFVANGKEAGTIKLDGSLTFHNGMTGKLSPVPGRSNAFSLSSQPDATIELVKGPDGEQLHWTDGNFSAYWSRTKK
jgi:hypothetical protein